MLNKVKKASVLITNYNNAQYIDACINSILSQQYSNIEIIFIDDSSTDKSLKKLEKYKKKIKVVKKKKKKLEIASLDQILSISECFKKSKGDIIFLLDSDDYFHKNKISTIMKKFNEDNKKKIIFDMPILKFNGYYKKIKKRIIYRNNFWPYLPPTSCISLRREEFSKLLKKVSYKTYPDIWLDFRIGVAAIYISKNIEFSELNLTYYRQLQTSISSKFSYLSKNWWKRRNQAHEYIKFFFKKNKIFYKKNLDYFLTKLINFFI